jgi:NADH:ubiquinone reductase (H+-translocating)
VVVGGGPTGCELAGVMPEIAKRAMHSDFRNIDTNETRVILVEASPEILSMYPPNLRERAKKDLERLGVDIRLGNRVVDINEEAVTLSNGEVIPTRTVIWAAGNQASPIAKWLDAPLDRAGRVLVEPDLSVPGHPEIYVAGDLAATFNDHKQPNPAVAQTAMQGGHAAGKNVLHRLYQEPTQPFRYWDKGNMAVLGRNKAIAEIFIPGVHGKSIKMTGFIAWCAWLFLHILYLVGFRNRLSVLLQWAYAYLTFQRGVRLISDTDKRSVEKVMHVTQPEPAKAAPVVEAPPVEVPTPSTSRLKTPVKIPVGSKAFDWESRR